MAITIFFFYISVQSQSYKGGGDQKINVGYEIYDLGNGVKASYDFGINQTFSMGFGGTYFITSDEEDYFIYLRAAYHFGDLFDLPSELDIYPGVELGYKSSENVGISGYLGVRYFFTKKFGVFAEFGNNGALGLSFNFS